MEGSDGFLRLPRPIGEIEGPSGGDCLWIQIPEGHSKEELRAEKGRGGKPPGASYIMSQSHHEGYCNFANNDDRRCVYHGGQRNPRVNRIRMGCRYGWIVDRF